MFIRVCARRIPPTFLNLRRKSQARESVRAAASLQNLVYRWRQPVALLSSTSTQQPPSPLPKKKTVSITFIERDGSEHVVKAKSGDTLLEVAKEHDIDVEGACEGTLSCSTCHLIVVDQERFGKIPDPLTEEEQDMLDLAVGLTDTSRLGCQIVVSKELDGLRLKLPEATRDIRNTED